MYDTFPRSPVTALDGITGSTNNFRFFSTSQKSAGTLPFLLLRAIIGLNFCNAIQLAQLLITYRALCWFSDCCNSDATMIFVSL